MRQRLSTLLVVAAVSLMALAACDSDPDIEGAESSESASVVPTSPAPAASTTSTSTQSAVDGAFTPAGSPPVPALPRSLEDLAGSAIAYLNDGGDVRDLEQAADRWGFLDGGGQVRAVDLDGDASDEVVVVAIDAANASATGAPGAVAVYACDDAGWHVVHSSADAGVEGTPELVALDDLNGEPGVEVLYQLRTCGAHTCTLLPVLLGYRPDDQVSGPLFTPPFEVGVPEGALSVDDTNGDGVREVVLDVGTVGSAGAGPQREYRHVRGWDGTRYSAVSTAVTTPEDQWAVIHFLQDADSIAAGGQYDEALALYERVLRDPPEDGWTGAEEVASLQTYARYRTMVTLAVAGRADDAEAAATTFAEHAPASTSTPGFIGIGHAFRAEYGLSGDPGAACAAAVAYAEQHPKSFELLNAFGYTNTQYEPSDICPFP
ncbi:MAG: hypothetical protein GEU80_11295 [Dehalococcoidia bacterium]|nr:hypothetical protein [Dehalococcoidia bacterium]